MPTMPQRIDCRTVLHSWRAEPHYAFPEPYTDFNDVVRALDREPANARLVDGIIVRIGREDPPAVISEWVRHFAARRGITVQMALPYS